MLIQVKIDTDSKFAGEIGQGVDRGVRISIIRRHRTHQFNAELGRFAQNALHVRIDGVVLRSRECNHLHVELSGVFLACLKGAADRFESVKRLMSACVRTRDVPHPSASANRRIVCRK